MIANPLPSPDPEALSCSDELSFTEHPEKEGQEAIAKRETGFVRWMRFVVLTVLVKSTISVAWTVYSYTAGNEKHQFKQDFKANAHKVLSGMGDSLDLTLTAADSMVVTMVSFARYTNASWPFVTIPNFETRSAKIRTLSKATILNLYLRVTKDQRLEWEAYAKANNGWVNESINAQAEDENYHGPIIYNYSFNDQIHDYDAMPMPEEDTYYVTWQNSPMIPRYAPYNWNLLSYVENRSITAIEKTHRVILTEAYNLPDPADEEAMYQYEIDVDYYSDYVKPGQDPGEPASDIYYPILDTTNRITIKDPENHAYKGMFAISIFWRNLIEGILPVGSNGVVMVFENECNPSFTFQINGPDVVYLGRGDLHDPLYNEYEISSSLFDLDSFSTTRSDYAGIPVDREHCPYHVKVYPSQEMENQYRSKQPVILTVAAVLIFLFTSAVFVMFDQVVEYRQRRVMKSATKTSAIVSSLFPSVVRDRLFEDESFSKIQTLNKGITATLARFATVNASLKNQNSSLMQENGPDEGDAELNGPPIANLFAHTTIFFADLAGFTKWSSTRTPAEVFELLETLYGAFDKIARRHSVFKVETIGDCYVAATGIPNAQDNHAVIMVRFARECMRRMDALLHTKLGSKLGNDTRELQMRVGLHSGPTTAGVLRGDRGRFQLFGDTVNTASRMESMGVPGRIHISQATADELITHGKCDWLIPRDERVMVKGKGEMQTYFADGAYTASSVVPSIYDKKPCTDASTTLSSDTESEGKDLPKVLASSSDSEVSLNAKEAFLAKRNKQLTSGNRINL